MQPESEVTPSLDPRFQEILADYLQGVESGRNSSHEEMLARHPEWADELATFFANRDRFALAAKPFRSDMATLGLESTSAGGPGRVPYFGDYRLLARSLGAAWASSIGPVRSVSIVSSP